MMPIFLLAIIGLWIAKRATPAIPAISTLQPRVAAFTPGPGVQRAPILTEQPPMAQPARTTIDATAAAPAESFFVDAGGTEDFTLKNPTAPPAVYSTLTNFNGGLGGAGFGGSGGSGSGGTGGGRGEIGF